MPELVPILEAALHGNSAEARRLLEEDGGQVSVRNLLGWTPLHVAAYRGDVEIAALLVAYGADVQARDLQGKTPLDVARSLSHRNGIVRMLERHAPS
ncbi:MAG: ankyrin repeat domain-containing protein [Armatimonadetes bacterium]|nr:ankyrin repeat domain-containing protein [Armatimonadota bacterium]